jgi:hypothetical protein
VGDRGRTTGKRSKTQEKKEKAHRGGEPTGRKESERQPEKEEAFLYFSFLSS